MIHPTAIIGPTAKLPNNCEIGPYSIIEDGVTVGAGCRIGPHVVLRKGTKLGDGVVVHPGAVLGGEPQDVSFDPSIESGVWIGSQTMVRELVTVNRSSKAGEATVIGDHCFLMAASHVAHDCVLGERVVLANAVLLAGHVHVGSYSFFGGSAAVHQFCRVGENVMLGGNAAVTLDLPPYSMVADRNRLAGLNLVGLRRRGFSREVIADLKKCFAVVYHDKSNPRLAAAEALKQETARTEEGRSFLQFFAAGKRGFARPGRNQD